MRTFHKHAIGLAVPLAFALTAPSAHAATAITAPVPAAGDVAVTTAKAPKAKKAVLKGKAPAGTIVLGGLTGKGARTKLIVAVVRPAGASVKGSGVKVGVTGRGAKVSAPTWIKSALATSGATLGSACPGAAPALGKVLGGKLAATDARRLGTALHAALCGGKGLTDSDRVFLAAQGLTVPGGSPGNKTTGPVVVTPPPTSGATTPSTGTDRPVPTPTPARPNPTPTPTATPDNGGPDECMDGKDNDGDGQVDFYSQTGTFVDPGCSKPGDTTETGEKTVPRQCGLGVYTKNTTTGYGADFDSISFDECPKNLVRGIVDLDVAITCDQWGYEGTSGTGFCSSISGNALLTGGKGNQWQTSGTAASSICGKQAYLLSWQEDGTVWESKGTVFDGAEVCGGDPPPPAKQCDNGIDDDGDGQADFDGAPGKAADPGCADANDTTESSEVAFPAGCVGVLAFLENGSNPRRMVALTGTTQAGASCPVVDKVWIDLTTTGIVDCGTPEWGGVPEGQCVISTGDAIEAVGGSSSDFLLGLDIGTDASCALDGQGTFAMRGTDGTPYEMPVAVGVADDEGITLC